MGILSRPKLHPQERYDLEDFFLAMSALRTDSRFYQKQFRSNTNQVVEGFSVTGIGLKAATVVMAGATLIIPEGTSDFSWYTASLTEPNIVIPDADLVDNSRNYVEVQLLTEDGTPLTRAFWDPETNSGLGAEFNQIVNTVTDIAIEAVVTTGGFTGDPDKIPIAIIDTDSFGNIKLILDQRSLFHRLSIPSDLDNEYNWGTKSEPGYSLNMSGAAGVFVAGETITIGAETATVVTGGTANIVFNEPSGISFGFGDGVVGGTSGATGTINTISESFIGVDKSITTDKEDFDAVKTQFKKVTGKRFWWQDPNTSIISLNNFLNSILVQNTSGASYHWDGTNLSFTDDDVTPADADIISYLRLLGYSGDLALTRQDGTGGSVVIPVLNNQVMFIKLPSSGNRTYDGVGSSSTNFQTVDIESFVISDENYWIAYREGSKLYIRNHGELQAGETAEISDNINQNILNILGITSETSFPTYTSTNYVDQSSSFKDSISRLDDRLEDNTNLKLIGNAVWSWASNSFSFDVATYIGIPGLTKERNTIPVPGAPVALADGEAAYVVVNRTPGGASNLTIVVAAVSSLTTSADRIIIARNVGGFLEIRD